MANIREFLEKNTIFNEHTVYWEDNYLTKIRRRNMTTEKSFLRGELNKHRYRVEEGFVAEWIYCLAGIKFHRKSRK